MKKKIISIVALLFVTMSLSGCTDAVAKLNDSNEVLFSVGKQNVTKGQLYSQMMNTYGPSAAIGESSTYIAQKEIPVTDEMKQSAQESIDSYKSYYGDAFTKHLEQIGMTEEEYINENLIASLQAAELPKKYIEENFDTVITLYKPVKATLLNFTTQDEANAALEELKNGGDPKEVATKNNSTSSGEPEIYTINSTSVDSVIRTVINSATKEDGWFKAAASDGATYAVIRIEENDVNNFKDEAIDALVELSTLQDESTAYWYNKYDFHIYDKIIYDAVAKDYPSYLVQDQLKQAIDQAVNAADEANSNE